MSDTKELAINGISYIFKEEFDTNLTLAYENESWDEWHILREFISNALDCVGGDISKISIHQECGSIIIQDKGSGYPLVYAKRIGATNKKDDATLIGNFGEGVKMSLLACVRKGISVYLTSREWLIEPRTSVIEGQEVLLYNIYEASEPMTGTTVIIEANEKVSGIIQNIGSYFLQFSQADCLHGTLYEGMYPLCDQISRLYNKGVYVKDITALYSYAISLESLNRDRDFISPQDIAQAVSSIWKDMDNPALIKELIRVSALPFNERSMYIEFHHYLITNHPDAWKRAFTDLYGMDALLHTDWLPEREATALGYKVINCDYKTADILRSAGIRNDTDTLQDDYEFAFVDELNTEESTTLNQIYALVGLLGIEVPEGVKIFEEYENRPNIQGLYNAKNQQVYMRKNVLTSGLEVALGVFLHEANHHISGSDDLSRDFAGSLCRMLTDLLLRYSAEMGIKSTICITDTEIILPGQISVGSNTYANIMGLGNKLYIHMAVATIEVDLPLVLATPVGGAKKVTIKPHCYTLKLPGKLSSALSYSIRDSPFSCVIKLCNQQPSGGAPYNEG